MEWLSSSTESHHKNIKSMTELDSLSVSENLVGSGLVGLDKVRLNESAIKIKSSLIEE